jgi:hypothetical protein
MASAIPADGPPSYTSIAGVRWEVVKPPGKSIHGKVLTKDVIERFAVCWDSVTWVVRQNTGWKDTDPVENKYAAFPIVWVHHGDQTFLTPALAGEVDAVTAERAGVTVAELDRDERVSLMFNGNKIVAPARPKTGQLAPAGYTQPKRAKPEPPSKEPKGKASAAQPACKKPKTGGNTCPWFLGRLASTAQCFDAEVTWDTVVAVRTPPNKPAPAPTKAPASLKAAAAPIVAAPKAALQKQPPPTKHVVAKPPAAVKTAASTKAAALKPASAKPTPVNPVPAKPMPAKPAASRAPASEGALFSVHAGRHEENVKNIFEYLSHCVDVPEATRALVSGMLPAVAKKPDERDHVFRALQLPMDKWTAGNVSVASEGKSEEEKKAIRAAFVVTRAVLAELMSSSPQAAAEDAMEW